MREGYAKEGIQCFPRSSQWVSMVDSYYMSMDLKANTLNDFPFLATKELH